jgi:hypothetical protein
MSDVLQAPCGRTRSRHGNLFVNQEQLKHHIENCPKCNPHQGERFAIPESDFYGCEDNPINDMYTADLPDGAANSISLWFGGEF